MDQSPQEHGYRSVDWTVPLLLEHLGRQCDEPLSDETIRRRLRRLGFVWKRSRYVLDPDPDLERKLGWQSLFDRGLLKGSQVDDWISAEAAAQRPHRCRRCCTRAEVVPGPPIGRHQVRCLDRA